jgi:hypothetical protein
MPHMPRKSAPGWPRRAFAKSEDRRERRRRAKIRELWTPFALLTVTPRRAGYWESPGKPITYADMLLPAATGKRPSVGEHGNARL